MAIRLRWVDGVLIAVCAVEVDEAPGDVYLDDAVHEALASKFAQDWQGETVLWGDDSDRFRLMDSVKVRNAEDTFGPISWTPQMVLDEAEYWDGIRQHYANQQEPEVQKLEDGRWVTSDPYPAQRTVVGRVVEWFRRLWLDILRSRV